jgi:NitT/TauT family transport system substrate-binding protein
MIHQKSLAAIVSLEESGISSPADLAGKKVADQPGSTVQVIFPVYAKAAGIDPSKVTWVPSAPPALPQLLASGQVDAIGQFVVGRSLIEGAASGRKAAFLPYGDVLPDLYGNGLMTSTELAEKNPELVKKFTEALLKGLEYSIAHPEETGEILKKYQPTQDAAVAAAEVEAMAPYVDAGGAQTGSIDRSRVEKVISIMEEAGAIDSGVTADQLVTFDNKDS